MIVVADTSVWVSYFRGDQTPASDALDALLNSESADFAMPDVVLMELLRGFTRAGDLHTAETALAPLRVVTTGGEDVARLAASIYRDLRLKGITVRSSIDLLLGAWCITHSAHLLHADRDFDGMAQHHGLQVVATPPLAH